MGRKEPIKKEIDLSRLSRKYGIGANKNKLIFDWENSLGYSVNGIYNNKEFEVKIINYESKNLLKIEYNNIEFDISTGSFVNCNLGRVLGMITVDFKHNKGKIFKDDNRDFTIIDMEYRQVYKKDGTLNQNEKWYKYHCNTCNWDEGWITEGHLEEGVGCGCCCGRVLIEGINTIVDTDTWMISYFQGGYDEAKLYTKWGYGNSNNPKGYIKPICPDCGRVKSKNICISGIYKNGTFGCSCGDGISYPNKFAFNLFEQFEIYFINEYSPDWIKPKAYDFYIPSINKIIEMDGSWHVKDNNRSGQTKEESQEKDDYKDEQARLHGIEVIRIDCDYDNMNNRFEYIKRNILNNKMLNKLFDLNKINWIKVEEFALSNLVKVACEIKNNNPVLSTVEIGLLMKLSDNPISSYLKEGEKRGWCHYNPEEEQIKGRMKGLNKAKEKSSKQVEIFKDGINLGNFPSCAELERQSEKLFGVKLKVAKISLVCLGKKPQYKGFTFKYTL